MKNINRLSQSELERLALLSEELGEAQQAIGKIIRHGYQSFNPYAMVRTTNRTDLEKELGDILFAIELMVENKDIVEQDLIIAKSQKAKKVFQFLHYQKPTGGLK